MKAMTIKITDRSTASQRAGYFFSIGSRSPNDKETRDQLRPRGCGVNATPGYGQRLYFIQLQHRKDRAISRLSQDKSFWRRGLGRHGGEWLVDRGGNGE